MRSCYRPARRTPIAAGKSLTAGNRMTGEPAALSGDGKLADGAKLPRRHCRLNFRRVPPYEPRHATMRLGEHLRLLARKFPANSLQRARNSLYLIRKFPAD